MEPAGFLLIESLSYGFIEDHQLRKLNAVRHCRGSLVGSHISDLCDAQAEILRGLCADIIALRISFTFSSREML